MSLRLGMEEKRAMFYILSAVMTVGKLRSFQFLQRQHSYHMLLLPVQRAAAPHSSFLFVLLHPRL